MYLEVSDGSSILTRLHAQLNDREFAHEEMFHFHPHVTIGGPVPAEDLDAITAKAAKAWETSLCPCRFELEDVVFVSIEANGGNGDWRRLWTHKLAHAKDRGEAAQAAASNRTS
jgi:hypothetical protein